MFPALLAGRASCWGGCGGDERLLPWETPGLVLARGRDKRSLGKPLGARPCPFLLKAEGWHTYWVSFRAKGQHRFLGGLPACLCWGQCLPQEGTCGPHADPPCTDRLGSEGGCHFCCQPCVLSQKVARGRCVLVRVTEGQRKRQGGPGLFMHQDMLGVCGPRRCLSPDFFSFNPSSQSPLLCIWVSVSLVTEDQFVVMSVITLALSGNMCI